MWTLLQIQFWQQLGPRRGHIVSIISRRRWNIWTDVESSEMQPEEDSGTSNLASEGLWTGQLWRAARSNLSINHLLGFLKDPTRMIDCAGESEDFVVHRRRNMPVAQLGRKVTLPPALARRGQLGGCKINCTMAEFWGWIGQQ